MGEDVRPTGTTAPPDAKPNEEASTGKASKSTRRSPRKDKDEGKRKKKKKEERDAKFGSKTGAPVKPEELHWAIPISSLVQDESLRGPLVDYIRKQSAQGRWVTCNAEIKMEASMEVAAETLEGQILDEVTRFWKARGDPAWPNTGMPCLRALIRDVNSAKRTERVIQAAVRSREAAARLEERGAPEREAAAAPRRPRPRPPDHAYQVNAKFWDHFRHRPGEVRERASAAWRAHRVLDPYAEEEEEEAQPPREEEAARARARPGKVPVPPEAPPQSPLSPERLARQRRLSARAAAGEESRSRESSASARSQRDGGSSSPKQGKGVEATRSPRRASAGGLSRQVSGASAGGLNRQVSGLSRRQVSTMTAVSTDAADYEDPPLRLIRLAEEPRRLAYGTQEARRRPFTDDAMEDFRTADYTSDLVEAAEWARARKVAQRIRSMAQARRRRGSRAADFDSNNQPESPRAPASPKSPRARGGSIQSPRTALPALGARSPGQPAKSAPPKTRGSVMSMPSTHVTDGLTSGWGGASTSGFTFASLSWMSSDCLPGDCLPPPSIMPPEGGARLEALEALEADWPVCRFIDACHGERQVPVSLDFATGRTRRLDLANCNLEDASLAPLTALLAEMKHVEEVDLEDNSCLTDKSLGPFLKALCSRAVASSMLRLNLSGCRRMGPAAHAAIADLVVRHAEDLRSIDLAGVKITMRSYLTLAVGISTHRRLQEVCLSDTGLGIGLAAGCSKVVADLLSCRSLLSLDVGWSTFSAEVCADIGANLRRCKQLETLILPNCTTAACSPKGDCAIEHFLEHVWVNLGLKKLDISQNMVSYSGALIAEDALEGHPSLTELDVSHNSLGVIGLRSMVRLISTLPRVKRLGCESCGPQAGAEGMIFSPSSLLGKYELDLERPCHRALLRMLCKACVLIGTSPAKAMSELSYDSQRVWSTPKEDETGRWAVPAEGRLDFTFVFDWMSGLLPRRSSLHARRDSKASISSSSGSRRNSRRASGTGEDPWDFQAFLTHHSKKVRRILPGRSALTLLALCHSQETQEPTRLAILSALGMDFVLTVPLLHELADRHDYGGDSLTRTLHCVAGGARARYFARQLALSVGSYLQCAKATRNVLRFNADNPNAHYSLSLDNASDYCVAEWVKLLDSWETEVQQLMGHRDVSQHGDLSRCRNLQFESERLEVESVAEWRVPSSGSLTVDYATAKRPRARSPCLDDVTFMSLLKLLHKTTAGERQQLEALRSVSHLLYVNVLQVRELLAFFLDEKMRVEAVQILFPRIMDMENEKLLRARFDSYTELELVWTRLGYASTFPFLQPEHAWYTLDLKLHDHRLVLSFLVQLRHAEDGDLVYELQDFDPEVLEDPALALREGLPKSWSDEEKIARSGSVEARYFPGRRRDFGLRKSLHEAFSLSTSVVAEHRVVWWWSESVEGAAELRAFVHWLYAVHPAPSEAIARIHAHAVDGKLTVQQLAQALEELECPLTADHPDADRYFFPVFDVLDPLGENVADMQYWPALQAVWEHTVLDMSDFVRWTVHRLEGQSDVLFRAWQRMEGGDSGLTLEAFAKRLREKLGYAGPAERIFELCAPEWSAARPATGEAEAPAPAPAPGEEPAAPPHLMTLEMFKVLNGFRPGGALALSASLQRSSGSASYSLPEFSRKTSCGFSRQVSGASSGAFSRQVSRESRGPSKSRA